MVILKRLLYRAVEVKGRAIREHLSLVWLPEEATPPTFILTEIDLALEVPHSRRETTLFCHSRTSLKEEGSTLSASR